MKALRDLRKFILIKSAEGRQKEVRDFIAANLQRLALAFRVPAQTLIDAIEVTQNDEVLAYRMLEAVIRAEGFVRKQRREKRMLAAQESAHVLARAVTWRGDRAIVDMPALLASTLTGRNDLLVFTCGEDFTVSVYMALLLDLAKVSRARIDLTGWVDRHGLHLRWRTGGLNLRSQNDEKASRIVLLLPPMPSVVAA